MFVLEWCVELIRLADQELDENSTAGQANDASKKISHFQTSDVSDDDRGDSDYKIHNGDSYHGTRWIYWISDTRRDSKWRLWIPEVAL